MAVNDKRVCSIINEKLRMSKGATIAERLGDAFDLISEERENRHKGDVDYAAAEHYLFARWLIANTGIFGYPFLQLANFGYSGIKAILPDSMIARFGRGPVTPGSWEELKWGATGGNDGLEDSADWFNVEPAAPSACQ
jgi:hypothetical protein